MSTVYTGEDIAGQLLNYCDKILNELFNDVNVNNNYDTISVINEIRTVIHQSLEPLLEKYFMTRISQALTFSTILAEDGVKFNKGLRISYSLPRLSRNRECIPYAKGFVIDSILTFLDERNVIKLNKYCLRIRKNKHEGQIYISVNPEIAPLISLMVPYERGLSYMSLLRTNMNNIWQIKSKLNTSLLGSHMIEKVCRVVVNYIKYGYIAHKKEKDHYYLVLNIRGNHINKVVEELRNSGFKPQTYRSRPNEVRIYRGKEILAKNSCKLWKVVRNRKYGEILKR